MVHTEETLVYRQLGSYTPSCVLPAKYRPLICRGQRIGDQTPRSQFSAKRKAGDCNIDLWLDGSIYPENPTTGQTPPFRDLKGLLCFLGDGLNGLFGYTSSLQNGSDPLMTEYREHCAQLLRLVEQFKEERSALQFEFTAERDTNLSRCVQDRQFFSQFVSSLQSRFHETKLVYQEQIRHLKANIAEHVADKVRHNEEASLELELFRESCSKEVQVLHNSYQSQLQDLNIELLKNRNDLSKCQMKCDRLLKLPFRRTQCRRKKDVSDLSQTSGHARRLKAVVRDILQSNTVQAIRQENSSTGSRKRLCGSRVTQKSTGMALANILSVGEAAALMETSKYRKVATDITNKHLKAVGNAVGPQEVLGTLDQSGVSHTGYAALFKTLKNGLRLVDKNLTLKSLPNPFRVGLLRTEINSNLRQYVGDYYHIKNSWEIPQTPQQKSENKSGPTHLHLDESNSLFVDIETVQRSMVRVYKMTLEEANNGPLIFVLKMDEAEIVKHEKLERISITLMNRALKEPDLNVKDNRYFSVQSEGDIWPVASFQVVKESHACLKWVLDQTNIPTLIKAQSSSQRLVVDGIGDFSVEWHLACDIKTIKCLYGLSHGPTAQHPCIYCWQQRAQSIVLNKAAATNPGSRKQRWDGGLFSQSIAAEPVRGSVGSPDGKGKWEPILDIPITRVHFCTLHAQCRIVEKIIHLQICYVWTIKDTTQRNEAIAAMEHALSKTGLAGGSVLLTKDAKLSGKNSDLPSKLSFNGSRCRKMFKPSSWSHLDSVWKDICNAERNNTNHGAAKKDRQDMWAAFSDLQVYFTGLALTAEQRAAYKGIVEKWGKAYVKAFGEVAVTHYVHVLVKHSSWFVSKYGSLAIWSTQGMEKSHYAAKTAYHKHTQHSGGRTRSSAIIQTYEWWFRVIQHREYEQEKKAVCSDQNEAAAGQVVTATRRQTSLSSDASAKHALWRATRVRHGSRWAPRQPNILGEVESDDQDSVTGPNTLSQ